MYHTDHSYNQKAKKILLALKGELTQNSCQKKINPYSPCGCKGCSIQQNRPVPTGFINPEVTNDRVMEMVKNRLEVIQGITQEILNSIERTEAIADKVGKKVQMEPWMIDKITLAADYLSAVENNATFGDGLEIID